MTTNTRKAKAKAKKKAKAAADKARYVKSVAAKTKTTKTRKMKMMAATAAKAKAVKAKAKAKKKIVKIGESQMADIVERILERLPSKSATIAELRDMLPKYAELSPADCAESRTRPGEQMWEQIVRNIVSHHREGFEGFPGGICLEGHKPEPKPKARKVKARKVKARKVKAKPKARKAIEMRLAA